LNYYGKFKAKIPLHFIDEIFLLATFKTIMVKRCLKNMSKKCCFVSFALLIFSFAAVEAQIMFDRRIQPGYNYQSYNNYFQFTAGYRFER
jgi:hypothetical protein